MTAQIHDVVVFGGQNYELLGVNGWGFFWPCRHALRVRMMHTACRRGYVCEYAVENDQLLLTALQVGMAEPPTELFGAQRRFIDRAATYSPIRLPVAFTGGLLLGGGYTHGPLLYMGRLAQRYAEILELAFDHGRLIEAADREQVIARRRAAARDGDTSIVTALGLDYPPIL